MKVGDTFFYDSEKIFNITMQVADHRVYEFIQPNTSYKIKRMYDSRTLRTNCEKMERTLVFERVKGNFNIKKHLSTFGENHFFEVDGGCKDYKIHLDSFQLATEQVENLKNLIELSEYRENRLNKILN